MIKYGIEITKPWSNEIYQHNSSVRSAVMSNVKKALNNIGDIDSLKSFGKGIAGYSYGYGMEFSDIVEDIKHQLEMSDNWWLNESYGSLVDKGFVESIEPFFIGFKKP
mgnify:CR=1 FL=1